MKVLSVRVQPSSNYPRLFCRHQLHACHIVWLLPFRHVLQSNLSNLSFTFRIMVLHCLSPPPPPPPPPEHFGCKYHAEHGSTQSTGAHRAREHTEHESTQSTGARDLGLSAYDGVTVNNDSPKYGLPSHYLLVNSDSPVIIY